MKEVYDQMKRRVQIPNNPQRIVSLVPSQTEFLYHIGLEDRIVGITSYCIHPRKEVKKVPKVGGTKDFSLDKIRNLNPDLIIGNKEENDKKGIEALSKEFPVWMSDIYTVEDALFMMKRLGTLCNRENETMLCVKTIEDSFKSIKKVNSPKRVLYFIWKNPYMLAGKNTFIDHLLERFGLINACSEERYPLATLQQIIDYKADMLLFSSEPYPFKQKDLDEFSNILPKDKCLLVDGEFFSWYGSRLLGTVEYISSIL